MFHSFGFQNLLCSLRFEGCVGMPGALRAVRPPTSGNPPPLPYWECAQCPVSQIGMAPRAAGFSDSHQMAGTGFYSNSLTSCHPTIKKAFNCFFSSHPMSDSGGACVHHWNQFAARARKGGSSGGAGSSQLPKDCHLWAFQKDRNTNLQHLPTQLC